MNLECMKEKRRCIYVFTDIDGTFMDEETYSYQPLLPIYYDLLNAGWWIIFVTSKTRAEVEVLLHDLEQNTPFIVENGSAIYFDKKANFDFTKEWKQKNGKWVYELGRPYEQICSILTHFEQENGTLKRFQTMTDREIADLTGLPIEHAKLARKREYTEAVLKPDRNVLEKFLPHIHTHGLQAIMGNRFLHVMDKRAGKGTAISRLKEMFRNTYRGDILTIALGDSPNDREMLEICDVSVVIPRKKTGQPDPSLRNIPGCIYAPQPGPVGWAMVMKHIFKSYNAYLN